MRRRFLDAVAMVPKDPMAPHGFCVGIVRIFGDGFAVRACRVEVESSVARFEKIGPADVRPQIRLLASRLGSGHGAREDWFHLLDDIGKLLVFQQMHVVKPEHGQLFLRGAHSGGVDIELRGSFKRLPRRRIIAGFLLLGFGGKQRSEILARFRAAVEILPNAPDCSTKRKNRREVPDPLENLRELAVLPVFFHR